MKPTSFLVAALLATAASLSPLSAQPGWTKYPTPPSRNVAPSVRHTCCESDWSTRSSQRKGSLLQQEMKCKEACPTHHAGKACPMVEAAKKCGAAVCAVCKDS